VPGMKVAISVPDPVFKAADQLARELKKSRSQLYSEAIAEYVGARGARAVTQKLNAVYSSEDSQVDDVLQEAQRRVLKDEAW
jgi:metal-responsive CopG/Arc/MetJ family transcriptional regulator